MAAARAAAAIALVRYRAAAAELEGPMVRALSADRRRRLVRLELPAVLAITGLAARAARGASPTV